MTSLPTRNEMCPLARAGASGFEKPTGVRIAKTKGSAIASTAEFG
jgi:hypothetical protein